jgi:hypothetical protein
MEYTLCELFGEDVRDELIRTNELQKVEELVQEIEHLVTEEAKWLKSVETIFRKKLSTSGFGFSPMQGSHPTYFLCYLSYLLEIRRRAHLDELIPAQSWPDIASAKGINVPEVCL